MTELTSESCLPGDTTARRENFFYDELLRLVGGTPDRTRAPTRGARTAMMLVGIDST
jgi:hypothetical protein